MTHTHPGTEWSDISKDLERELTWVATYASPERRAQLLQFMKGLFERAIVAQREAGIEEGIRKVGQWFKLPVHIHDTMCATCGGTLVTVRGTHPNMPKRKTCPTCTLEILEEIWHGTNNRDAVQNTDAAAAIRNGIGNK